MILLQNNPLSLFNAIVLKTYIFTYNRIEMLLNKNLFKNLLIFSLAFTLFCSSFEPLFIYSDTADEYEEELEQKRLEKEEKEKILNQTKADIDAINQSGLSIDGKIALMDEKINEVLNQINAKEEAIKQKEAELDERQEDMDSRKEQISRVSEYLYKNTRVSFFESFISQGDTQNLLRNLNYKKYAINSQIDEIKKLTEEYQLIIEAREGLESQKGILGEQKKALDESRAVFVAEKARIEAEYWAAVQKQNQLNSEISNLNASINDLQRAIIYARSGAQIINTNSVPSSGDYNATLAGFRNNAPSGSFGVFSIGAYTHRNGMSQWGAQARAESGQSVDQILQAYFPGATLRKDYPSMSNINVVGYGVIPFEEVYLQGIAEAPSWWNINMLKAQAILARTYAIKYTNNGQGAICTTQSCQVYQGGYIGGQWEQAVNETRGWVLVDGNGNPILSEYASTHGGWINGVGWDTTDGSASGDWMSRAWDSIAGHPWFYRSWYRQNYSDSSWDCGHPAWMSQEEMADIINSWMVLNGIDVIAPVDVSRVVPVTLNTCNGGGGNPYSMQDVRNLLNNPVTEIYDYPVVIMDGYGNSTDIVFNTNRGQVVVPATSFKSTYNLRAPAFLSIPQFGFTFFNIERKI